MCPMLKSFYAVMKSDVKSTPYLQKAMVITNSKIMYYELYVF